MKSKILLIGGNGFIGSHLIDALLREGHSVRVLDTRDELFRAPLTQVEYVRGSFAETSIVQQAIKGCDVLVQLAHGTVPFSSLNHPEQEVLDSVSTFVNMLDHFKAGDIKKIMYFSTGGAVYGNPQYSPIDENAIANPISPYGVAKLMIEKYLYMFSYLYGIRYIIVRPSNPFGPRQNYLGNQGVIPIFLNHIVKSKPIQIWGDGNAAKDYIYISDLVDATVKLIDSEFDNRSYNIGSGIGTSLNRLVENIQEICGLKAKIEYLPEKKYDVHNIVLSTKNLFSKIGWRPSVDLKDGIRRTWEWFRTQKSIQSQ